MIKYVLADAARCDLIEIRRYLDEHAGPMIANGVLADVREAIRTIAKNPGIGHQREDLTRHNVLFWPIHSYFVLYDPDSRPLSVLGVLHSSRNLISILKSR